MDESQWIERAQSAEARLATQKTAFESAIEKVKAFKANFGIRETSDGSIIVDYEKFVERLGLQGAMELRQIIDEKYHVSGAPGEKPRIKLVHEK